MAVPVNPIERYAKPEGMRKTTPISERFRTKYEEQETGCWAWTDSTSAAGYGYLAIGGRAGVKVPAHRLAYEMFVGPIPVGLVVNHACHEWDTTCKGGNACPHRRCVNPQHLNLLTRGENVSREHSRWVNPGVGARARVPAGEPGAGRFMKGVA